MLSKEKLYFNFSSVVPSGIALDDKLGSHSREIFFEPISMSGLEEMHNYSIDPRLYEYFEFEPFKKIEETAAYIEKLEKRMAGDPLDKTTMYWFVRRQCDNHLIGTAGLVALDYSRQSVEWAYAVDPSLWGEGYIFKIQEALKQYVFEVLELNRLHGKTMITNERTINSVLASGMKHEGIQREALRMDGIFYDAWEYSMLREEYLKSKNTLTTTDIQYSSQDIIDIISSVLTEEDITSESDMCSVMSWDSLNHMSIMVAISEQTGITFSPSEMMRANSVESIAKLLAIRFK